MPYKTCFAERLISTLLEFLQHVDQIYWDFVVEPIVTLPLAAMSILNSSIFCGSLDAAASFGGILWRRRKFELKI